jgi:TolB protein
VQLNNPRTHSSEIRVVDLSTGQTRTLSVPGADHLDEAPSWFPDGTRLAFQSNRTGTMEIWVMGDDGSNPRQITGLPEAGAAATDQPKKP